MVPFMWITKTSSLVSKLIKKKKKLQKEQVFWKGWQTKLKLNLLYRIKKANQRHTSRVEHQFCFLKCTQL